MRYSLVFIGWLVCLNLMAQNEVDSLRTLIQELDGSERIDTQYLLVNHLVNIDPSEAEIIATEMLRQSEAIGYKQGESKAYLGLGTSYNIRSQVDTAITFFKKSLAIAQDIGSQRLVGWSGVSLGASYLRTYQLGFAIEAFQSALLAARQEGDKGLELTCLMNTAIVHTYLKEDEKAESLLKEALEISLDRNVTLRTGQIYGNLGNLEFERSNYSLSQEYFEKALPEFQKLGASQMVSVIYTQLGRTNSKLGKSEPALNFYDQALEIRKSSGDHRGVTSVLRYKAQTLMEMRRYGESQRLLETLGPMTQDLNDPHISMDVEEISYQLAEYSRDFQKAMAHLKKYQVHKDTIDARAQRQEVKRQTAEFDYAQLVQQLEQERQQKEIAELRRSRQALVILLMTLTIVAVAIVYLVNRSRLRKQIIINEQEKELLNQRVITQASKIDEIESEISRLEGHYSETAENKKELAQYLSGSKVEPKDWAAFKLLFEKIYPTVLTSFQEFNLTLNDQRMIAMITLGLSTKEISTILSITPKSVSKARARLSTKLGLTETKDLESFILEQQ